MLSLKNVSKTYSKNGGSNVKALQDVSIKIEDGSFVAIVGASGSGKSTLMNILGLLDRPSSGSYFINDQEVNKKTDNELAKIRNQKIGFIFQSFHLLPRTTAKDNVELPLIYSDNNRNGISAIDVLKAVGLEKRTHHFPNELSGGEQQRVAIARALINDPDIILADEPTGNLDSNASDEIMKIFQELHRDGRTIVLITHEPEIAEHAQRIVQISDGKILRDNKVKSPRVAI